MIDKSKTYRTRDGREVRIYATDGYGSYPVHGAVLTEEGWFPRHWTEQGELSNGRLVPSAHDLIKVRPRNKRTVWINVYGPESQTSHHSRKQADDERDGHCIACVEVDLDFREGEGL